MCPESHPLGGSSTSEASERLCESASSPNLVCTRCARALTSKLQAGPAGDQRGLGSGLGSQAGAGSVPAPGETRKCGAPVEQTCECCLFAGSTEMDQSASGGPVGWVRGPGSGQGYVGGRRGLRGSMNTRVLVNVERAVGVPAPVTSCLCQPKRRSGRGCLCASSESCTWVLLMQHLICGSLRDWQCRCPPRVCLSVCTSGTRAQLRY